MNIIDRFFLNVFLYYENREGYHLARFTTIIIILLISFLYLFLVNIFIEYMTETKFLPKIEGVFRKERVMIFLGVINLPFFLILKNRYSEDKIDKLILKKEEYSIKYPIVLVLILILLPMILILLLSSK